jgi:hypothetical protein
MCATQNNISTLFYQKIGEVLNYFNTHTHTHTHISGSIPPTLYCFKSAKESIFSEFSYIIYIIYILFTAATSFGHDVVLGIFRNRLVHNRSESLPKTHCVLHEKAVRFISKHSAFYSKTQCVLYINTVCFSHPCKLLKINNEINLDFLTICRQKRNNDVC